MTVNNTAIKVCPLVPAADVGMWRAVFGSLDGIHVSLAELTQRLREVEENGGEAALLQVEVNGEHLATIGLRR